MNPHPPIFRRPVRAAAIVAVVVALLGSGAALIPGVNAPAALAFAFVCGPIMGWFSVGLVLASNLSAARWWWLGSAVPLTVMAVVAIGFARWPQAMMSHWRVVGGASIVVLVMWLLAGCLLAVRGWTSYAPQRRTFAAANPRFGNESSPSIAT